MDTLLLDTIAWDLVLDIDGNIAVASDPYSQAQDAASAIRLFQGELWYDTSKGVPFWASILGKQPPLSLMKAKFNAASLTVPGITAARTFITGIVNRLVTGQVQITNSENQTQIANF